MWIAVAVSGSSITWQRLATHEALLAEVADRMADVDAADAARSIADAAILERLTFQEVAAKVDLTALNQNSNFADFSNPTTPVAWSVTGPAVTRVPGLRYAYALRHTAQLNTRSDLSQVVPAYTLSVGEQVTLQADVVFNSGSFAGSALVLRLFTMANVPVDLQLNLATSVTTGGVIATELDRLYRYRSTISIPAGVDVSKPGLLIAANHTTNANAANDITWHRAAFSLVTNNGSSDADTAFIRGEF